MTNHSIATTFRHLELENEPMMAVHASEIV